MEKLRQVLENALDKNTKEELLEIAEDYENDPEGFMENYCGF